VNERNDGGENKFSFLLFSSLIEEGRLRLFSHKTQYCDKKIKRYCDKKIFLSHGFQD
jgi:hypothetical protein